MRLGCVIAVCVLVGAITHPLVGIALFPIGIVRVFR